MAKTAEIYTGATSLTDVERARIREKMGLPPRKQTVAESKDNGTAGNPKPAEIPTDASTMSQFVAEKFNWMESPVTGELIKDLTEQIASAEEEARKMAMTFSVHQDIFRIVRLLNKSTELRNILNKYGRNKPSTH